jgi:nitroreductase
MTDSASSISVDSRLTVSKAGFSGYAGIFGELLVDRFTCRAYRDTPVPLETIRAILELAQLTASWCNTQPWQTIVTAGATTRALVETLMVHGPAMLSAPEPDYPYPDSYRGIYADRKREVGRQLYGCMGVARGDHAGASRQAQENLRLFGAPHVAIITVDRALGVYGAVDCGAYLSNFMLAARAFSIDTSPQAALAGCAPLIRAALDIGEDRAILCGISFGYGIADHAANGFRTGRAKIDAVAFFRGFSSNEASR